MNNTKQQQKASGGQKNTMRKTCWVKISPFDISR